MSLSQLGASALLPAKTQLTAAAVTKYREVVQKLNRHANTVDQGSTSLALRDAKQRALESLQERRANMQAKLNPMRALQRLRDNLVLRLSTHQGPLQGGSNINFSFLKTLDDGHTSLKLQNDDEEAAAMEKLVGGSNILRRAVLASLGGLCKAFLTATTSVEIINAERMIAALERRPGQGLITVSNHVASLDDPMVTTALLPPQYLLKPASLRWALCATDRCFKNAALIPFFRAGKVLPVDRGAGVDQLGMRVARNRLQHGDWIHIFPEGTRGDGSKMLPARRGVGWLVASSVSVSSSSSPTTSEREYQSINTSNLPLIVPYVHSGMEEIVPRGAIVPRPGKNVRVLVGEVIHVEDLIRDAELNNWSERKLHAAIADRVGATLYSLKAELDGVPVEAVAPQVASAELALLEENLLPLSIHDEAYNTRNQRWRRRWEALEALSSLAQRMHTTNALLIVKNSSSSGENKGMQVHDGGQLNAISLRDFMDTLTEVSKSRAKHLQHMLATASAARNDENNNNMSPS